LCSGICSGPTAELLQYMPDWKEKLPEIWRGGGGRKDKWQRSDDPAGVSLGVWGLGKPNPGRRRRGQKDRALGSGCGMVCAMILQGVPRFADQISPGLGRALVKLFAEDLAKDEAIRAVFTEERCHPETRDMCKAVDRNGETATDRVFRDAVHGIVDDAVPPLPAYMVMFACLAGKPRPPPGARGYHRECFAGGGLSAFGAVAAYAELGYEHLDVTLVEGLRWRGMVAKRAIELLASRFPGFEVRIDVDTRPIEAEPLLQTRLDQWKAIAEASHFSSSSLSPSCRKTSGANARGGASRGDFRQAYLARYIFNYDGDSYDCRTLEAAALLKKPAMQALGHDVKDMTTMLRDIERFANCTKDGVGA